MDQNYNDSPIFHLTVTPKNRPKVKLYSHMG